MVEKRNGKKCFRTISEPKQIFRGEDFIPDLMFAKYKKILKIKIPRMKGLLF